MFIIKSKSRQGRDIYYSFNYEVSKFYWSPVMGDAFFLRNEYEAWETCEHAEENTSNRKEGEPVIVMQVTFKSLGERQEQTRQDDEDQHRNRGER